MKTGLYVHIPFCRAKCAYCDFNSYAGMEHLFAAYTRALLLEAGIAASLTSASAETLYVGGGTPTVLPAESLVQVITVCRGLFRLEPGAEVTVEANPGTVDEGYLRELVRAGVNRLSLGVQSFHDDELALLGRIHRAEEATQAVALARKAGFENVNVDLIYGIPGQSLARWRASLERALAMEPEHISLYCLTLEEGTPLFERIARGELPRPDDDLAADMYLLAEELLAGEGFRHYEISNWARPGFECRHNIRYWLNLPYIGLGAGAHSYHRGRRYHNVLHPAEYIRRMEKGKPEGEMPPSVAEIEAISTETEMAETVILGLRLVEEGVTFERFAARFGRDLMEVYGREIRELLALGLLEVYERGIRLTPKGRLLGNEAFERFV